MAWRNCYCSVKLINEVNAKWPGRDKTSDGTIGDAAHASRQSDHNPWVKVDGQGVVRARDIDVDGIDAGWLAEFLRMRGAIGDVRLIGGGYVILNKRITTSDWKGWKQYTGSNPHTKHLHVSFTRNRVGFDSVADWNLGGVTFPPKPAGEKYPTIGRGFANDPAAVKLIQRFLGVVKEGDPGYGEFGPKTEEKVKDYQRMQKLTPDGVVGPLTWAATGL